MKQRLLIITLLLLAITGFSYYAITNHQQHSDQINNSTSQPETNQPLTNIRHLVLYYGETCPHCHQVNDYIKQNNIDHKAYIDRKEIYYNTANNQEMAQIAKQCGLPTNSIGVPFMWTGQQCLVGGQQIISFLNQEIN